MQNLEIENCLYLLIRSAEGLRNTDYIGKTDAYCLCRIGDIGSDWDKKDSKTERCSTVVSNSINPEWNFPFKYGLDIPTLESLELHVKVMDNDLFTSDDFVAEVRIPLKVLLEKYNSFGKYVLSTGGTLCVLCGDKVKKVLGDYSSNLSDKPLWWQSLGQFFSSLDDEFVYTNRMTQFLLAGIRNETALRDWLLKNGGKNGIWNGPEDGKCKTYMKHRDVHSRLLVFPERFGDGDIERQNNLGFQKLNGYIWPELEDPMIGLGQTQENHAFTREFLDNALSPESGNWNREMISEYVDMFFSKKKFKTSDFKVWTTIVLHKLHLGIDLSWEEGVEFISMQRSLLIAIAPSEGIVKSLVFRSVLGLDKAIEQKKEWLERYKLVLKSNCEYRNYIENHKLNMSFEKKVVLLASNIMDSLLFAGGVSVPTVLSYCIGLLYSSWLKKRKEVVVNECDVAKYIMEVIRFFPPVSGFAYKDKLSGYAIYLSLHTAQCDKEAWGEDAEEFVLRDMKVYKDLMVAWADPATATGSEKNNARVCPAKDLSFNMIYEIMKKFISQKSEWKSDKNGDAVVVNNYAISDIQLSKQ